MVTGLVVAVAVTVVEVATTASIISNVGFGRSEAGSLPAPLIAQGLKGIIPSEVASPRIVRRSR
jgi:hypothetical protein